MLLNEVRTIEQTNAELRTVLIFAFFIQRDKINFHFHESGRWQLLKLFTVASYQKHEITESNRSVAVPKNPVNLLIKLPDTVAVYYKM